MPYSSRRAGIPRPVSRNSIPPLSPSPRPRSLSVRLSFFHADAGFDVRGLRHGSIRRIKEGDPRKRANVFRRDLFPRHERFLQGGRSARARSLARCGSVTVVQSPGKLNFFGDQRTRLYNRHDCGRWEGNIRPLGLWDGRSSFIRDAARPRECTGRKDANAAENFHCR